MVRGLGSRIAHRPRAGRRLLALAGLGLGAIVVGGVPLLATYGSGKTIVPEVNLVVGGFGLVLGSWWSDIWVAAGGDRSRGRARALPGLAVELSGTWQHDGYVGERALIAPAAELRRGRWAARAAGLLASDGSARGGRLDVEARPWAPTPRDLPHLGTARHTGTALAIRAALQHHAEHDQGFALTTGEVVVRGRVELARLDRHLAGTFLELEDGFALELASYAHAGTDVQALLLSRFAWGAYLPCGAGELSLFYDHRRDHLAGGLAAGRAAGFLGSIGATAEVVVAPGWVALGRLEIGTSWLTTVGLRRELP